VPDATRVQDDSEYHQRVGGHLQTWWGHLEVSSDVHTFFYKFIRKLMRDGEVLRTRTWEEPIPRDHQRAAASPIDVASVY
jgi:hypothetical protein